MPKYAAGELHVASTDDLPWACAPTPGVSYKSLRFDPDTGAGAVLIHMTPNTTYPRHRASEGIDLLVLDGDVEVAGVSLNRGGFAHIPPQTEDAPRTRSGCVLYANFSGKVEHIHANPLR